MKNQVFGSVYAEKYDLFYEDKDYEAECDLLEEVFRRHGDGKIQTILDLGCGTGNHAIPLSQRGYRVRGVDLSSEMLALAARKVEADRQDGSSNLPTFVQGDVRTVALGQTFDAVIMMFAVLGYQTTNEDVLTALRTARRHLRQGGIFVCDVWYGPAVLTINPSDRVKVIRRDDGQLIRVASATLDVRHHSCKVNYHLWHLNQNSVVSETQEEHTMRYFFPMELEHYLFQSGLTLYGMYPFPNLNVTVDEQTWNILVCAQAD